MFDTILSSMFKTGVGVLCGAVAYDIKFNDGKAIVKIIEAFKKNEENETDIAVLREEVDNLKSYIRDHARSELAEKGI